MKKKTKKKLLIALLIILVGQGVAGSSIWNYLLSAPGVDKTKKVFVITPNESTSTIVSRLEKEGFLRNGLVFRIYLRIHNLEKNIQSGDFKLSPSLSATQLAQELSHGAVDKWVTIVEGLRNEEIASILEQKLGIPSKDFLKAAQEGYMFPDTYLLPKDAAAMDIVKILRNNFDTKFKDLENLVPKSGLTKQQVVTLASIVEREARDDSQRAIIAGILLKRLNKGMALETDATVQYALGYDQMSKSWWTKNITNEDLQIDSPYNTRKKVGLPPGPICNPGLSAIKAVLNPQSTSYWYYLHDKAGKVYYAQTLEEHNENVARYLK